FEAGDQPGRGAGPLRRLGHHLGGPQAAAHGPGMRREDDGVARLHRGEGLEEDGGSRIGARDEPGDHTDRCPHGGHPVGFVDPEHADRPLAEHVAGHEGGVVTVLQDLVLVHAVTRLVDGQTGQLLGGRRAGPGHGPEDVVELLLVGTGEGVEGGTGLPGLVPDLGQCGEVSVEHEAGHGRSPSGSVRETRRSGRRPGGAQVLAAAAAPSPRMSSTSSWGRGMTCTETTSPTLPAATAPASVAALTAPTSPRTMTVTSPPPICSLPTSRTLAALIMASAASIAPTSPRVSIRPRAPPGARPLPSVAI